MAPLRVLYRLALLGLHIAWALAFVVLCALAGRRPPPALVSCWHRWACRILGVRVRVEGRPAPMPVLMAANHVSWLDIPVLGGLAPVAFLAKAEIRRWPLVGRLASAAGTLYIERGRHHASAVAAAMAARLGEGRGILFFPEGTTTRGPGIRRFLWPLFRAAVDAGTPVQPVALRYLEDGRISPHAPFVGDANLLPHALAILARPGIEARVRFLAPIRGGDARALSTAAHAAVAEASSDGDQTPP